MAVAPEARARQRQRVDEIDIVYHMHKQRFCLTTRVWQLACDLFSHTIHCCQHESMWSGALLIRLCVEVGRLESDVELPDRYTGVCCSAAYSIY